MKEGGNNAIVGKEWGRSREKGKESRCRSEGKRKSGRSMEGQRRRRQEGKRKR